MKLSASARWLLPWMAFAAVTASAQPAQRPPPWSPTKRAQISILTVDRALAAFRTLCMETFPDAEAFDRAAAASDLGFARVPGMPRGRRAWTSSYGDLSFVERLYEPGAPTLPQCNFDLALSGRQSRDELTRRIEAEFAGGAERRELPAAVVWRLGRMNGRYWRTLRYKTPFEDDRLVTFGLSRDPDDWPPFGEPAQ
jgi:hypothetical protein